jgi:hypothetical protein
MPANAMLMNVRTRADVTHMAAPLIITSVGDEAVRHAIGVDKRADESSDSN